MDVFVKVKNQPKWLIFATIIVLVGVLLLSKHYFVAKPLSSPEIDQLLMQATHGQDQKSVERLLQASESEQVEASLALGKVYLFQQQFKRAIPLLDSLAESGHPEAATLLGKLYFQGNDQIQKNNALALKWFNVAYHEQDPTAAYYLGLIYKNGYGIQKQSEQAVKYFTFAANHQIPNAMFMLANAYQFGDGVKTDLKQALFWYQKAADLELPEAIQELAHFYQYGNEGVKPDQTAYHHQIMEIGHSLKHPAITP